MSAAHKGRRFEHEVREMFRNAGYSVMRGAGSKGELFGEKVDLIASKETRDTDYTVYLTVVGLQCKAKSRRRKTHEEHGNEKQHPSAGRQPAQN